MKRVLTRAQVERHRETNAIYLASHREHAREYSRKWYYANRERALKWAKEYRLRNPRRVRARHLRRLYGITVEEYERLFEKQGGVCALCGESRISKASPNGNLCVDHSHTTGKVRGLLCNWCNLAVGYMEKNPEWFQKTTVYLRETP